MEVVNGTAVRIPYHHRAISSEMERPRDWSAGDESRSDRGSLRIVVVTLRRQPTPALHESVRTRDEAPDSRSEGQTSYPRSDFQIS